MIFPFRSERGSIRSHAVGVLAGVGLASIALFGRSTAESVMDFFLELRKDGFSTTASATLSASEITIDTTMVPLPSTFWVEQVEKTSIVQPPTDVLEERRPPLVLTSLHQTPSTNIERRPPSAEVRVPEPKAEPTPEPAPVFDSNKLATALHENLASVFTGDLPYLLLKSGDRLYEGSSLAEGVTLEAITTSGILCSTPVGIVKVDSRGQFAPESLAPAPPAEPSPFPLDVGPQPDAPADEPLPRMPESPLWQQSSDSPAL